MKNVKIVCLVGIVALAFVGCATDKNARPVQGLNPACSVYAIANACEVQFGKKISREERLKVWADTKKFGRDEGASLLSAFSAGCRAGWIPETAWLRYTSYPLDEIKEAPLLGRIGTHAITILSISEEDGTVIYLDPTLVDPQSTTFKRINNLCGGMYWRIFVPTK